MKILLVEPEQLPEVREIDGGLRTMQRLVGGVVQTLYPFEDPVALVCNDEGKLLGLPGNRALRNEQGKFYDIVCGTFFLCGAPPGSGRFISLTEGQAEKYWKRFMAPEMFLNVNGQIVVLPMI